MNASMGRYDSRTSINPFTDSSFRHNVEHSALIDEFLQDEAAVNDLFRGAGLSSETISDGDFRGEPSYGDRFYGDNFYDD